ncbi:MAG: hypothetical protein Ct9H90mP16_20410 [Candidatus Poseidoniales archaeon]|nr:MAG: hypothetical protein Ct9H90mP16_20410 [Candidatus Poseidoniales archaeon]
MKGVLFGIFYSGVSILHFLITFPCLQQGIGSRFLPFQFDATAGAALGMLVLGILPLSSLSVEPIDFQLTWPGTWMADSSCCPFASWWVVGSRLCIAKIARCTYLIRDFCFNRY